MEPHITIGLLTCCPSPGRPSSEMARGIADRVIYYQYRRDRARRSPRGIDEQVALGPTRRRRARCGQMQPVY